MSPFGLLELKPPGASRVSHHSYAGKKFPNTRNVWCSKLIVERQQEKLQYECIAGFMKLKFPSEWLIKTVYSDPSNRTSDQVVFLIRK